MGQAMGRMPKEEPFQGWGSLLPAPPQQAYLKSVVRWIQPSHSSPAEGPVCSAARRTCSLSPSLLSSGLGLVGPEVRASWVLAAPRHALQTLPQCPRGLGLVPLRPLPPKSWQLPLHALQTLPKGSSSERATCFLLDSTLSRTATRHPGSE